MDQSQQNGMALTSAGWEAPRVVEPRGWEFEQAAVAGPCRGQPTYTPQQSPDAAGYFSTAVYPASSTMLHGQPGMEWQSHK